MEFGLKWVESVRSRPLSYEVTYNVFSGTLNPTHFTSYGHIMSFIRAKRRRTPVWPTATNSRAGCSEPAVY